MNYYFRGEIMSYNPLAFGLILVGTGALMFANYLYAHFKEHINHSKEKTYGSVFLLIGILAGIFGFGLFFSTPIPGQYIEIYGVGYLLFSMLFIIAALCLLNSWDYRPASVFASIAGVILISSACVVYHFQMSKSPLGTAFIFLLSGLGSISTYKLAHLHGYKNQKGYLVIAITIFALVGLIMLYSGLSAQFEHIAMALAA